MLQIHILVYAASLLAAAVDYHVQEDMVLSSKYTVRCSMFEGSTASNHNGFHN